MNQLESYLRQPGLLRLWQAVKRKYESLGRVGGRVRITQLTPEEREAIGGLLAANFTGLTDCSVELARLDEILRTSRFHVGLVEALHIIFAGNVQTRQENAAAAAQAWEEFFAALAAVPQREVTARWLAELKEGRGSGYRTLLALYRLDPALARSTLQLCLQALDGLPLWRQTRTRLPVFAAELTGNPHALDRNTLLGRLLLQGILFVLGAGTDVTSAEAQREVWRRAGLEGDDMSSTVAVAGLRVLPDDPRAEIFAAAATTHSPLLLPLRFFEQKTAWAMQAVYVVENPTVFSAILDAATQADIPPLVCVSGQPSVAALKLLDELTATGTTVYYSGDFDWEGLQIGVRLAERLGAAFRPWFFDTFTYEAAPYGLPLDAPQAQRLASLTIPWDRQLPSAIARRGVVVYQEALVGNMLASFSLSCVDGTA